MVYISRKSAYEMKVGTLGFIFRYQKSTRQSPRKSVSRRGCTLLVSYFNYNSIKYVKLMWWFKKQIYPKIQRLSVFRSICILVFRTFVYQINGIPNFNLSEYLTFRKLTFRNYGSSEICLSIMTHQKNERPSYFK